MRALAATASGLLISVVSLGVVSGPAVHQYPLPEAGGSVQLGGGGVELFCPEPNADSLGRIATDGSITQRRISIGSRPLAVARESAGDGRIIFTEAGTNRIGIIDANGNLTEYDIPTPDSNPRGISAPAVIWFTEYDGNRIGALNPPAAVVEYVVPTANAGPLGIAPGPSANPNSYDLWFTEFLANKIGRIDQNGVITEYPIPSHDSGPTRIAEGVDALGNPVMYFTESKANKIGKITNAGVVTEYSVPTSGAGLSDIVTDFNGGMWFSERFAGKLGRLGPDGSFVEFALPGSRPDGIAITSENPDGTDAPLSVWWVDGTNRIVGRLSENQILAVGAGHDATFDTEFDLSSSDGDPMVARVGTHPPHACPLSCPDPGVVVNVPKSGTATQLASDIPATNGVELYYVTGEGFFGIADLPEAQAFLIDEGNGARSELPLVDYWTVADSQPPSTNTIHQPKLTFPARRAAGTQTDLVLAAIESIGVLNVRIDAVLPGTGVVATTNKSVVGTLFINDVLRAMGIFGDFDGDLVVTRQSSSGLFWGLTEVTEGNTLILAPPGSELDNHGCTAGPAHCNRPRTTRVVTRGSGAQTVHESVSSPNRDEDRVP